MNAFGQTLEKYGADFSALRSFDEDGPDLLPYATLVSARNAGDADLIALGAVYEWQNAPLIFLINGDQLRDDPKRLNRIRRRIAMRGDAPYLGVVFGGRLTVHRVSLDTDAPSKTRIALDIPSGQEKATFAYLGNKRPGVVSNRQWISQVVLKLLSGSISALTSPRTGVVGDDAISLVGRALFTRFLGDRELLPVSLIPNGHEEAATLFDDENRATVTSRWLDDTFNGDFLPLTAGLFKQLPKAAYAVLGDILRRAPRGQLYLGWEEKWGNLDFAQIPVGVLSQAYEHYLREHVPDKQRKEGGYYTPRIIADLMVRGAFHALRRNKIAHQVRVLDPAAGAGVFLLTAFRQLVAERWLHDQKRPDTKTLREILYDQITGFDINESALRFAALGLYLISIELDPHPEPVHKLRFKNLRNTLLHKVGEPGNNAPSKSLGSLGHQVSDEHIGRYDLVIGNPPWTSGTGLIEWAEVNKIVARIARARLTGADFPPLPNEALDIPFVWRAIEWGKPGCQIVFALHSRLLFQQGKGMPEARSTLFRALDVTGIVNGTELRQSKVWPEISAPFCLLFACNQIPQPGAGFRFVSPRLEYSLNSAGSLRIDANNAEVVTSEQVIQRPEILKILFRGSQLDLEVYDRLQVHAFETLGEFWRKHFGAVRGHLKHAGNGYQHLRNSSKIKKSGDGKPGVSAAYLNGIPELNPEAMRVIKIDTTKLKKFSLDRIDRPRSRSLFYGPLLIVRKSPPANAGRIRVIVSDQDLIFNETYYGYSGKEHSDGMQLVRYLALLVGSKPALWHVLMTSGEFGFEREVVEKFTIEKILVPAFETLSPSDKNQISSLFQAIVQNDCEANWNYVDMWVASLYRLKQRDLKVISDTLRFGLPFAENRHIAQARPSAMEVEAFCRILTSELRPWAQRVGMEISVFSADISATSPWGGVVVSTNQASIKRTKNSLSNAWLDVMRVADQSAATEVIYPDIAQGTLWLGRLNQARYWSQSQARLLARHIVWEHMESLLGQQKA